MQLRKNAKVELLSRAPLFQGCSKKELGEIAGIADELDLRDGAVLIREGERGSEFFVLVDGTVRVTKSGRRLRDLGPGDWFGEIALISDVPRTSTVTATSPVRVLVVTDRAFKGLVHRVPSIAVKVLESVAERLKPETV
jgi:CRP-like cAMP-binding protein